MEVKEINGNYKEYYEKRNKIGSGAYGKVYKAINKKTKEIRAIKIMDIDTDKGEFINHMNNELKNMKICSNQNIYSVKLYECFHFNNKFAIVMELCDDNLQNILNKKNEGFTCEEIYNIMNQLNNTFKIMNENKIIHRDIKLENIVVKYNNEKSKINYIVKLTDYGISKQLMNTKGKTNIGTSLTMAPEILKGEGEIYDNKCDLWSIGIIIYQLYFKDYPYKGTDAAIYNQIKNYGKKILKRTSNTNLNNLIDSLLISDPRKRINYEEYFNHPFFKNHLNKNIKINKNNYITSEIEIKEDNKNERIINSYEQFYKEKKKELENINNEELRKMLINEENKNEKEIKENCIIKINDEIFPFRYFYNFKKNGKYRIIYLFKKNITQCNFMFCDCKSLTNIDLSNFNTQNVTDMIGMFSDCKSLTNIDLSNFNTQNVRDMSYMFSGCKSLINIDLSNFNTQNVTKISCMFNECKSLTSINLSNFNTQNITDMSGLFIWCKSLKSINLSNFNTQNVINMFGMFCGCELLTNIDLSNFNTQNVTNMREMFIWCKSLTSLDLSNFNTQNVTNISNMLYGCKSLKKDNIFSKDNKILKEIKDS